jgi:hypothetical protein
MTSALRACCVLLTQDERYSPSATRARYVAARIVQRMHAVGCVEAIAMPTRPGPKETPYLRVFLRVAQGPFGGFGAADAAWSKGPPVHAELLVDSVDVLAATLRNVRRFSRTAHAVRRCLGITAPLTASSAYEATRAAELYVMMLLTTTGQEELDLASAYIGRPVPGLQ